MPGDDDAVQLALFDGGPDVARLKQEAARLGSHAYSENTRSAYAIDWADFEEWCADAGRVALPAKSQTVEWYIVDQLRTHAIASIDRRLAAIASYHAEAGFESPLTRAVRDVMRGARREKGTAQKSRAALSVADLRKICRMLPASKSRGNRLAARNRAMMAVGFAGALRVSELLALEVRDIQFVRQGLIITVRRGKTDQEGKGRSIGVFYGKSAYCCPVRTLRAWLKWRGSEPGRLWPMKARSFLDVIKGLVAKVGLDPKLYGSHSLRAGFVTAAATAGVDAALIMQRTGHRSVATVVKYVRPATLFSRDALARAL